MFFWFLWYSIINLLGGFMDNLTAKDIVEYTIQRKYKGRIIDIKVHDGYIDGRRSTTITCDYNPILIGFSNGSDEKVQYFIERDYEIAKNEIDNKRFVKKISKLFRGK